VTDEDKPDAFYHGTKAQLNPGDLIAPGFAGNYADRKQNTYVYLTGTLEAAIWGAELALGDGPGRIYVVEPTGPIMDDPNLTNTRYPGNPTKSYRSSEPLRVTGEITDWQGHPPETVQAMKDRIKAEEEEENERLMYVALTRAIGRLVVPCVIDTKGDAKGRRRAGGAPSWARSRPATP